MSRQIAHHQHYWPRESAGQMMIEKVPVVPPSYTLARTYTYLTQNIKKFETINYIYVINANRKLLGVFSLKELYRLPGEIKVEKIHKKSPLVTVSPTTDQEKAAYLALKHNLKAIPVVDNQGVLLGVIPNDTIISVLYKELREDILQLAGIQRSHVGLDNILTIPLLQAVKHRIPWLFLGLLGGIMAAKVISHFENTLEENLILAAFIPLVVYIADAVGTQLEAFTIRDLALFRKLNILRYLLKQFSIILTTSLLLGVTITVISVLLNHNLYLAFVLGLAIVATSLSSVFTGIFIPLLFRNLQLDPANASGPIGTIIQDILSVFLYFTIASWLL